MDLHSINGIGQAALVWLTVFGGIWGLLKANGIIRVSEKDKRTQAAEKAIGVLTQVAQIAVSATEQTSGGKGPVKLTEAMIRAHELLRSHGITASSDALEHTIEAAVQWMNTGSLATEGLAAAVKDVASRT
jgi:LL-H family phage holin